MEEKSFGNMIAALRKAKGWTQLELAEKMGITDKAVSKWERDLSYPDIGSLPRLAEILGVSVEELMNLRKEPEAGGKKASDIISVIFRAVALAMGVAAAVLSVLGELETESGMTMLGIGLGCLAVYTFTDKSDKE